jgi:hypothetical protein
VVTVPGRLRPPQVNLVLEVLLLVVLLTGLTSWAVPDGWNGWVARAHGVVGLSLLLLARGKLRGSVRAGFRRGRWTRWVSVAFGVVVLATVVLGVVHSTGLWYGTGPWSALWTHSLLGAVAAGLLVWHVGTRPVRARLVDLDRRSFLRVGVVGGAALGLYVAQEAATRVVGLAGGRRRATGSYELASHDPARMPEVIWLDDEVPADTAAASWSLEVAGQAVTVATLRERARPVTAVIDCTGGWWAEQSWDAVPLSDLLTVEDRSVRVRSATGYARLFAPDDLNRLYLAVGYGGESLRSGHGGPVRLVVPGRRGPWWVKWVTSVEAASTPSWLQSPLPLT